MEADNTKVPNQKRIAIIGAGVCGLLSIAALKEEGFDPVCFESSDRYGGLWNYREESIDGFGSLMPTTITIQSKEMGAFSNFPPKKEHSIYMRHQEFFEYVTDYYKHHDCERHIHFSTEVIHVRKAVDYGKTGRWSVTVKDKISQKDSNDIFDGVIVATGHFNYPKMENFPGLEKFKGEVLHTHGLKRVHKYSDQKVLVVGAGSSGLDAAECISSLAKQVYLSTRSGMFVFNRVGPKGYPLDFTLYRKYLTYFLERLPPKFSSWYLETFYVDPKFDHSLYYIKPKCHAICKDPVVNEAIAYKLLSGSVLQKGAVKEFAENGVVFEDEEAVTELDAVIMATGYTFKFPFLEDGLLEIENGRINLYQCVYPTHLPHSTLAFMGFLNPFGPGLPIAEIQCRWIARVFSGKANLPCKNIMVKDVIKRHERNEHRYSPSEYMSVRVDFVSYLDEIASEIGCKPNLLKYCFTDFRLFLRLLFGPSLSYQYRLEGPHNWKGAREAIMTCEERLHWPLSRGKRTKKGVLQLIIEYIGNLIPRNIFIH